jgi:hypothetical protein
MNIDRNNFFQGTVADFTSCAPPQGDPDYVSDSGSRYWYRDTGVIRQSDHWSWVANCLWLCNGGAPTVLSTGFCAWSDFRPMAERKPYLDRLEADRKARIQARERQQRGEQMELLVSGRSVTCLRTYRHGKQQRQDRIMLVVARHTPQYVITTDGSTDA